MSSSSIPPILQNISNIIQPLLQYYNDIKAKTRSNITPEYEGAIYYISKKLLEEAYLSGDSFPDESSIEHLLSHVTFNSIYECYSNKTIQAFLNEIRHIASDYNNSIIIADIKFKVIQFNFMSMTLSIIHSICEEYFSSPPQMAIEDYDKERFLYWVWLLFSLFNQQFFNKTTEVSLAMELLSYILQEIRKNINDNYNDVNNSFNHEYFFGLIQEKLSKTSMIIPKKKNGISKDIVEKVYKDIKAYYPKGTFKYSNEEEINAILSKLETEIMNKVNKDDISVIHIFNCFPIETFDKQIDFIKANLTQKQNQRITNTLNSGSYTGNSICLNSIKLKIGLEAFIEELKAYNYLDITFVFVKYSNLLFVQLPFSFRTLYKWFHDDYIMIYFIKMDLKFNYIFVKSLFIKLFHLALNHNVIDIDKIYDKDFYYNFSAVVFYIYFNLQFIDNQTIIINMTYAFLKSINSLEHFCFFNTYTIVLALLKLTNIPFNIRSIIKKMQQDLLLYCLFEGKSSFYKHLIPADNNNNNHTDKRHSSVLRTIIDDFYQSSFEIIYKIGNKLNYSMEKKEEIFKYFLFLVHSINHINKYMKNMYSDIIIIIVITCSQSKTEDDLKGEYIKVKLRYIEEKKRSLLPEVFQLFLNETNDSIEQLLKEIFKLRGMKAVNDNDEANIMITDYDCRSFLLKSTQNYNTIYSCAYSPQKNDNNTNANFLSHKRIRALTPTIHDKTLHSSPFVSKISNFNSNKPAGAFKNLNPQF